MLAEHLVLFSNDVFPCSSVAFRFIHCSVLLPLDRNTTPLFRDEKMDKVEFQKTCQALEAMKSYMSTPTGISQMKSKCFKLTQDIPVILLYWSLFTLVACALVRCRQAHFFFWAVRFVLKFSYRNENLPRILRKVTRSYSAGMDSAAVHPLIGYVLWWNQPPKPSKITYAEWVRYRRQPLQPL